MNEEIGIEAAQFSEKVYIKGIFVGVYLDCFAYYIKKTFHSSSNGYESMIEAWTTYLLKIKKNNCVCCSVPTWLGPLLLGFDSW